MIFLLLGSDDFSKKEFTADLQHKENAETVSFYEFSNMSEVLNAILNENLFSKRKLVKLYDFFAAGVLEGEELEAFLTKISKSLNTVLLIEQKLDKRKSETKKLFVNKNLKILEFEMPETAEFQKWVSERSKKYKLVFGPGALDLFVQRMAIEKGDFGGPVFDLWQADSEMRKLAAFSGGNAVTAEQLRDLVAENTDENIFKITNAIGDKNKELATKYLMDYMDRFPGTDEKTKVIGLSGLLSDQLRGILLLQALLVSGVSSEKITEQTGFSSGRIFIFKKLAQRFTQAKLLEALKKMELLDQEIKTSQGPAALQFFMILDSFMK